jgi:hypothetical protein
MTAADLLAPVARWTAYRRFLLLEGVRTSIVSAEEARRAHAISAEEWEVWMRQRSAFGAEGLKSRRLARARRATP